MGEGLQNPDLNLNQLYDQAGQAMPDFADFGQNFLQHLQEKHPEQFTGVEFQHAPLKDLERIQDKVTGDYDGNHTRVADMVRGRLLVETPEQIQIVRNEIAALQESLGIVKVKDFYAEPLETHFRTLNTQVQLPNGHVAEFRIDQLDVADGDMEAAQRSATIETVSNISAAGGALAGAAIGTAIMPVVGTTVGAVVGGVGAGIASGEATELIYDHADDIADFFDHGDDRLLERLPTVSDENMPPELQHFIEIKKLLVDAQNEREALGTDKWFSDDGLDDRRDALDEKIERIEQMYDEAYDEHEDNGALETALASLDNWERAEQVAQSAIEKVKETAFENEASHAHSNVDLSLS